MPDNGELIQAQAEAVSDHVKALRSFTDPRKRGRPSVYSPNLVADICALLEDGLSLGQICDDPKMPHYSTVLDWRKFSPEIDEAISRARTRGIDRLVEQAAEIADNSSLDYITVEKGKKTIVVVDHEHVSRSKLRVETRLKIAAMLDPLRYGSGVTIRGDKENPVQVTSPKQLTEAQLYEIASRGLPKPADPPK